MVSFCIIIQLNNGARFLGKKLNTHSFGSVLYDRRIAVGFVLRDGMNYFGSSMNWM